MVSKLVVTSALPALRASCASPRSGLVSVNTRLISTSTLSCTAASARLARSTPAVRSAFNAPRFPSALARIGVFGAGRSMATQAISKGDQIPNATFTYVPYSPELADGTACGAPTKIQTHDAFKGKKVVIVAVPGAYTPTCHVNHIPPYISKAAEFKSKGVDQVIVLAQNDPFVMSAWGVQNKAEDKVIFATDLNLEFSKGVGSTADLSAMGFGERTGRYALIVDDLKVVDFSSEPNPGAVEVSGADHVLAKL